MDTSISPPRQQRSRESFARVRAAVVSLLEQQGDFTLTEVSALSGLAVGSIYGRVGSKIALFRTVQGEELDRIDTLVENSLAGVFSAGEGSLRDGVRGLIAGYVGVLWDEAPILRAFHRHASEDEVLAARGRESGDHAERAFAANITRVAEQHGLRIPPHAAIWTHELVYSLASRHLGFGLVPGGLPGVAISRDDVVREMSLTVESYLRVAAA